jgi:histidinol dehydrogenase
MRINRYVIDELSDADRERLVRRAQSDIHSLVPEVQKIVADVRARGDEALVDYTFRFDGAKLTDATLTVSGDEFDYAERQVDDRVREAMGRAIASVQAHHRAQLTHANWMVETAPGVLTGERLTPIAEVGLYVPRGKGSFPSVAIMLAVPAALAGVRHIVMCTPPGPDGAVDAASLVAARLCGVHTVLKIGGAQAIAALAYGTATVPRVRKIVGPGNQYVAAAKRLVSGDVDPGLPAGPSESVILCDGAADPEVAAHEWLVEAEHGPDSAALLVTPSAALADAACGFATKLVAALPAPRREFCEAVLATYGGVVLARDLGDAISFVNEYAPEHLRVLVDRPFDILPKIVNVGEVLLGEYSSIPFGNFCAGVNAILPTGGNARAYSSLGVADFLKRSSFAYVSAEGVSAIGDVAVVLAEYEGFPAHASAARFTMERARRSV